MNTQGLFTANPVGKPSRIDSTQRITPNSWVVSLLRRKNAANPKHTYILVESIEQDGIGVLRRYDLVIDETRQELAKVVIKRYGGLDVNEMDEATEALVRLDENDDKLYAKSWSIARGLVATLDQNVQADTTKEIMYNQLGEHAYSGSAEGHSCFTWAREKLNGLHDSDITLPEKWSDYIVAHPSLYLPAESTSGNMKCRVM
jgi:hypothetical protein